MNTRTKKITLIASTAVLAAGTTLAGVSYASIPDSSTGQISACRVTGDAGNVRIIDKQAGASCHSYETEVDWNATSKLTDYERVTNTFNLTANQVDGITVSCDSGRKVVGGGFSVPDGSWSGGTSGSNIKTWASYPDSDTSWTVKSYNQGGTTLTVTAYAVCAAG